MVDINEVEKLIRQKRENFIRLKEKHDNLINMKLQKERRVEELNKEKEKLDKARLLLLESAEYQRERVKGEFEQMVTNALQFILREDIQFEINVKDTKKSELEFLIKSTRDNVVTRTGIESSRGDGVADIVGLALNIAMLECVDNPKNKGPLVLDEPAKQVSKDHIERVGDFLKEISKGFNRQIIMVTHINELSGYADTKYEVSLDGSVSKVKKM